MRLLTEPRPSGEVLSWGRDLLERTLPPAVRSLPASVRLVAGFHLGLCDERGRPTPGPRGKAVRPTLALLMAEASGGASEAALPAAVAVELVHNHSLLHDDVMDRDVLRRHRRTAWSVFGVGPAILAGDALLTLAFQTLNDAGGPRTEQALSLLGAAEQELVAGQMADLAFEGRADVGLAECVEMARSKTGALMGCACALGALSATADAQRIDQARAFGEHLGLAFQLVDDVLGIWGDPAVTGKPSHSDITVRKRSLPVVVALTSATAAGRELAALYARDEALTPEDVASAAALVTASGARDWCHAEASAQLDAALRELRAMASDGRAMDELETLARLVTTRDH